MCCSVQALTILVTLIHTVVNKKYSYFVPELDVGLCQVLDLSEEFALSECAVLHEGNT